MLRVTLINQKDFVVKELIACYITLQSQLIMLRVFSAAWLNFLNLEEEKEMLKRLGCSLTVVGALVFSVGVVNSALVSPVRAEDKDKDKDKEEKSGKLMTGAVTTAFAGTVMSEDKDKSKDKEGKSGELMTGAITTAFAGTVMSEDEGKDKEKEKEGKFAELS